MSLIQSSVTSALVRLACLGLLFALTGCASISERTHAYIGAPAFPPTDPARVKILAAEPSQPRVRLGEIVLSIEGNPSRDAVEKKIRDAAARLGADAAFVTYDRMHIIPLVWGSPWGPPTVSQEMRRDLVAVAIKYK